MLTYPTLFSLFKFSIVSLLCFQPCLAETIINDDFGDGEPTTNTTQIGSGFDSISNTSSAGWVEADSTIMHTAGTTSGIPTARLQSIDRFAANSSLPNELIVATFVMKDWSRVVEPTAATNFNARLGIGITEALATHIDTAPNALDGLWILMNFDSNGLSAGESGLSYVDNGTRTRLGNSWSFDDNGIDTEGATAIELTIPAVATPREDRIGIDMIASDISITLSIGADFWSIEFSSSDPTVVLPNSQSGTFSALQLTNDLSEAALNIYHQGDNLHSVTFDEISVFAGEPTEFTFDVDITPVEAGYRLDWESQAGFLYNVRSSETLLGELSSWTLVQGGLPAAAGDTTSFTFDSQGSPPKLFFRIEEFPAPPTVAFSENFDAQASLPVGWTTAALTGDTATTLWEIGVPQNSGPSAAFSSPNCAGTNISADYGHDTAITLTSPGTIDLTTAGNATLTFQQYRDVEGSFDSVSIRVLDATDDSQLGEPLYTSSANPVLNWTLESFAIPAEALGKMVKLEFRFESDEENGNLLFAGWYLDDIEVSFSN